MISIIEVISLPKIQEIVQISMKKIQEKIYSEKLQMASKHFFSLGCPNASLLGAVGSGQLGQNFFQTSEIGGPFM